jgi:hypothetical protein
MNEMHLYFILSKTTSTLITHTYIQMNGKMHTLLLKVHVDRTLVEHNSRIHSQVVSFAWQCLLCATMWLSWAGSSSASAHTAGQTEQLRKETKKSRFCDVSCLVDPFRNCSLCFALRVCHAMYAERLPAYGSHVVAHSRIVYSIRRSDSNWVSN